jgi:hypothetical protein
MATEKTNFINVVTDNTTETTNNNTKTPVEYGMNFDGSESIKWQPETFEAFGKTTRINSAELSSKICAHFRQTFHEIKGCNLVVMPNNQIGVELYFERNTEPLPAGKIMNLESLVDPVGTGSKNNLYERMNVVQNRAKGKTFTLNNETKLLLSKFMFGGKNANLPNNKKVWGNENVLREIHIPVNDPFRRAYNTDRILVRVFGLDIRRILQELYGRDIITKTVANDAGDTNYRSEARYEVRFIKGNPDGTFVMNIEQFDLAAVEKIFVQENPIPQQYLGVQMYS